MRANGREAWKTKQFRGFAPGAADVAVNRSDSSRTGPGTQFGPIPVTGFTH